MHLGKGDLTEQLKRLAVANLKSAVLEGVPPKEAGRGLVIQHDTCERRLVGGPDANKAPGATKVRSINLQLILKELALYSDRLALQGIHVKLNKVSEAIDEIKLRPLQREVLEARPLQNPTLKGSPITRRPANGDNLNPKLRILAISAYPHTPHPKPIKRYTLP